jgi:hypothetical protein
MSARWYELKTQQGTAGYCYGYFFNVDEDELKAIPEF